MSLLRSLGIDQLTPRQRLDLIDEIWDSLPERVNADEVPAWHFEVLADRLAEAEANPGVGTPYQEALARIEQSR